ncbi:MAG: hypothetical protein RL189_2825 [Pseudomonadota bacterium]|jgi:hypothetical protein
MKHAAYALFAVIVLAPLGCKPKSTDTQVSGASMQQGERHLVFAESGFQHKVSCEFKIRQGDTPAQWQSAPEIASARKQVELLINKVGLLAEYRVCVDIFSKDNSRAVKLDSKSCAARECAPPATGLQRILKGTDVDLRDGNFVSRTTLYLNDRTRGEKEQTLIHLSEKKVHLTWRMTDDISKPDFKVDGKELTTWARQNSGKICASL